MLGRASRLAVDFGSWTASDDEQEAIAAARTERRQLEAERDVRPGAR